MGNGSGSRFIINSSPKLPLYSQPLVSSQFHNKMTFSTKNSYLYFSMSKMSQAVEYQLDSFSKESIMSIYGEIGWKPEGGSRGEVGGTLNIEPRPIPHSPKTLLG